MYSKFIYVNILNNKVTWVKCMPNKCFARFFFSPNYLLLFYYLFLQGLINSSNTNKIN